MNTAAAGAGNAWAIVVNLISLPLLLRGLGADGLGLWVLLQSFSARRGWLSLADLGIGLAATRSIARGSGSGAQRSEIDTLIATTWAVSVILGLAAAALLATVGLWLLPGLFRTPDGLRTHVELAIGLYALQVPCDLLIDAANDCLTGLQRVDSARAIDALRRTLVGAATVGAALVYHNIAAVAAASASATLVAAGVGIPLFARSALPRARPSISVARRLISDSATLGLFAAFCVVQATMDRLVVGFVLGPSQVAITEIALQVYNGADAILAAVTGAVIPAAAYLHGRGDRTGLRILLMTGSKYVCLTSLPFTIGAMVLAWPLVATWVGGQYAPAVLPIVLAMVYLLIATPSQVASYIVQTGPSSRSLIRAYILATSANLILTIGLVPYLGVPGAFLATVPAMRLAFSDASAAPHEFSRASLVPVLLPCVALISTIAALTLLHTPTRLLLLLGTLLGGAAYCAVAIWRTGSLRELRSVLGYRGTAADLALPTPRG